MVVWELGVYNRCIGELLAAQAKAVGKAKGTDGQRNLP